jgi:CBS domain-containing protein
MKVSEIMTIAAVTDRRDDSLADAAKKMWEQQTGSLLVVEGDNRLVRIITERDILKAVANGADLGVVNVEDVMGREPITVHPGAKLREAAKTMTDHWIRHLPVVDDGQLVGIISTRDVAAVLAGALNEPEAMQQLVESSELARDKRLKRIEHGAWD